ncbi:MAG: hypothetical protein ACKOWE_05540 [Micrococcales bacterium]
MIQFVIGEGVNRDEVRFEFKRDKTVVYFDDGERECVHEIEPANYEKFLESIGQAGNRSMSNGVKAAIEANELEKIRQFVHELGATVFSWRSGF